MSSRADHLKARRRRTYMRAYRARPERRLRARRQQYHWRKTNPEYNRVWRLRTEYGMTPEQYDAMYEAQGRCCAACGTPEPRRLHVDHIHETGKVRGILCHNCNTALGLAKDCPSRLMALALYAEKHQ